jgi:DNA-binding response OmpR family regulator
MRWSTGIILLVDGDDEVLKTVTESLAVTDYTILHAPTAQEAVSVLSRLRYTVDLLVIDLESPDEGGLGIFGLLTTPGCRRASRIIAKTSRQDESFLGQVYWLGIDAILRKPTSAEQLVGTIHAVLSGRPKWIC